MPFLRQGLHSPRDSRRCSSAIHGRYAGAASALGVTVYFPAVTQSADWKHMLWWDELFLPVSQSELFTTSKPRCWVAWMSESRQVIIQTVIWTERERGCLDRNDYKIQEHFYLGFFCTVQIMKTSEINFNQFTSLISLRRGYKWTSGSCLVSLLMLSFKLPETYCGTDFLPVWRWMWNVHHHCDFHSAPSSSLWGFVVFCIFVLQRSRENDSCNKLLGYKQAAACIVVAVHPVSSV